MHNEIIFDKNNFLILEADSPGRYEAMRKLWCSVFGDEPEFVDSMFRCFGDEIKGYIVVERDACNRSGNEVSISAVSALVCYKCGELTISDADMEEVCGKPVYVSYAVCTDPEFRGMGLAGALTAYVRDSVIDDGALSLVSPADESLQDFYAELGYRPFFFTSETTAYADEAIMGMSGFPGDDPADDSSEPFEPALDIAEIDAAAYNRYREAFLIDEPHIVLSSRMIEFVRIDSFNGNGLFAVNGGDAICAVSYADGADAGRLVLTELIVNPVLEEISSEIGSEIAGRLAKHFGAAIVEYREPGMRSCQSMLAGKLARTEAGMPKAAYFGFPID